MNVSIRVLYIISQVLYRKNIPHSSQSEENFIFPWKFAFRTAFQAFLVQKSKFFLPKLRYLDLTREMTANCFTVQARFKIRIKLNFTEKLQSTIPLSFFITQALWNRKFPWKLLNEFFIEFHNFCTEFYPQSQKCLVLRWKLIFRKGFQTFLVEKSEFSQQKL